MGSLGILVQHKSNKKDVQKTGQEESEAVDPKDKKMIEEIKTISKKGNSAEVKCDKNGNYVIYEVQKKKKKVG